MKNLSAPLTEAELDQLGRLLLDRIDDDADMKGKDEGVLDVSELDGFLTAIVSGPVTVPPSRWVPAMWGDFEPVWENPQDFETLFSLLMRHMNGIVEMLMAQPADFEPMFAERDVKGKTYTIVDEWCQGYMRGVALTVDQWSTDSPEMTILLAPIRAFTSETAWRAHDLSATETENIQNAITPNVRAIHAYWLARRAHQAPSVALAQRVAPRVGRNDPCPCGSGKKYKKCCLH